MAGVGEGGQPVADVHQTHRHRQFLLERSELTEVVRECGERGAAGGQPHHVGGHVRVAVPVAADPRSGAQDRLGQQVGVGPAGLQRRAHLRIDLRNDLEERRRVVPQAGFDLVLDLQSRQPDQRGLPQREDVSAQLGLDVAAFLGPGQAVHPHPHQLGDAVLGVEHGAPPRLGGVRGDDGRHQRPDQRVGHGVRIQVRRVEFEVGGGQAAVLGRFTGGLVDRPAALAMDVLGHVGQQREVGEGADDGDGLVNIDAVEQRDDVGAVDFGATHPKRLHPGAFYQVEDGVTVLVANGLPQDRAEQADVLTHRLRRFPSHLGAQDRTDRCQRGIGRLSHPPSIEGEPISRMTSPLR